MNEARVVQQIADAIHNLLEEKFLGKPTTQETINAMGTLAHNSLMRSLQNNDALNLSDQIRFEITGSTETDTVVFTPKNFFTGLLYKGIFYPPALYGSKVYHTEHGRYQWDDANTFGFVPNIGVQHIEVSFKI